MLNPRRIAFTTSFVLLFIHSFLIDTSLAADCKITDMKWIEYEPVDKSTRIVNREKNTYNQGDEAYLYYTTSCDCFGKIVTFYLDDISVDRVLRILKTDSGEEGNWGWTKIHIPDVGEGIYKIRMVFPHIGSKSLILKINIPTHKKEGDWSAYVEERISQRKDYAKNFENKMLSSGQDWYISAAGMRAKTLVLKYVLMSRPIWHRIMSDNKLLNTWRELGFRDIEFTDGNKFKKTYTFKRPLKD